MNTKFTFGYFVQKMIFTTVIVVVVYPLVALLQVAVWLRLVTLAQIVNFGFALVGKGREMQGKE